eukprot:maker-scaffold_14-snap-gene-3.21-mRNA-1 protein AED:0.10 eAED:0.10 QI:98/1/1/1/0.5/0.33/3/70/181
MKRKTKYRKHVEDAVLNSFPEPSEMEELVVVLGSRGGNLLEVKPLLREEESSLCILPAKFKKLVWVGRGMVLIVSKSEQEYLTNKNKNGSVKYTVNHILFEDQVKHLIAKKYFTKEQLNKAIGREIVSNDREDASKKKEKVCSADEKSDNVSDGSQSDTDSIFVNTNRVGYMSSSDESSIA